jgi:hypothetical protein
MSANTTASPATTTYTGGCHCGAVRFEADVDLATPVSRCNCTLCTRRGVTAAITRPAGFRLLSGDEALSTYTWRAKTFTFLFCSRCGIHVFGRGDLPELGGAFVSVNVNCLDDIDVATLKVIYWDGRHENWDAGPRDTPWPVRADGQVRAQPAAA